MNKRTLIILCLAVFIFPVQAVQAEEETNPLAGLDGYIEKGMADWELPGMALAVVKGDEILLMKGYGTRETGKDLPVDAHTIFAIGSTSKAFTAFTLGLLVHDGRISWDDPVIKHMPDFQLYDPWVTREIRVRDLLANRSGLGDATDLLWYGTDYSREEIVRRLRYAQPVASFRYTYAYRNVMFLVGGQVVTALTGSWDDFLAERVFTPLGMTRSGTTVAKLSEMDNVASPHLRISGKITPVPYRTMDNICPAGGLYSCIHDMAQWLKLNMDEGMYGEKRIIDAAVIRDIHSQQTPVPLIPAIQEKFPDAKRFDYCLSWLTVDHRGKLMVWHNGAIDGMRAVIGFIPEENIGAVLLSNSEVQNFHEALFMYIMDKLLGETPRDWSALYLEQHQALDRRKAEAQKQFMASRKPDTSPSLPIKAYAGAYSNPLNGLFRITCEKDKLVVHWSTALVAELAHWHHDTFLGTWRDMAADARMGKFLLTFSLDEWGAVKAVSMSDFITFTRVEEDSR